jgi:hypothetical protein
MGKRKKIPEVAPWTPPTWLRSEAVGDVEPDTTPEVIAGIGTYAESELSIRPVIGAQATKRYDCPLCNQTIEIGVPHIVVVPEVAPDHRRHFHTSCWNRRSRRRPGRG